MLSNEIWKLLLPHTYPSDLRWGLTYTYTYQIKFSASIPNELQNYYKNVAKTTGTGYTSFIHTFIAASTIKLGFCFKLIISSIIFTGLLKNNPIGKKICVLHWEEILPVGLTRI